MKLFASQVHDAAATPLNRPSTSIIWPKLIEWAKAHYRYRTFQKEEVIPTRPGLLYFVAHGMVRMTGETPMPQHPGSLAVLSEETFVNLTGPGQPFEVLAHQACQVQAIAHTDEVHVFWLYWQDVEPWSNLKNDVLDQFRYQHQRLLLRLNAMGQRHTADRILLFIKLLIEEHGQVQGKDVFLPCPLTHSQLASAIGTTRVTVTRAIGSLRKRGELLLSSEGCLGLPLSIIS